MEKKFIIKIPQDVTFQAKQKGEEIPLSRNNLLALAEILRGENPTEPKQLQELLIKNLVSLEKVEGLALKDLESILPDTGPGEKIYLSPFLKTEFFFGDNNEPFPLSGLALLTNLFLETSFAYAWAPLIQRLRESANSMLKNALTRGGIPDKKKILNVLHHICLKECRQEPLSRFLSATMDSKEVFSFSIKKENRLQKNSCQFPQVALKLQMQNASFSENITEFFSEEIPFVAKMFRRLNHGAVKKDLAEFIISSPNPRLLHGLLNTLIKLEAISKNPCKEKKATAWAPINADLSSLHFGHASLLIQLGRSFAAVDPWFLPWSPQYQSQPFAAQEIPSLEAIFITHHHWDHINPQSLLQYPEGVPIVVPKQDKNLALFPRFVEFLKLFGCENIVELDHWEKFSFKDGGSCMAVPFFGEGTAEEKFRGNCYLMERNNRRILVHVDASPDSQGASDLTTGVIQKIVDTAGPIDVVYATRRQELHFGIDSWELFPIAMAHSPMAWLDVVENCDCPKEYLAELAKATRCKEFLLYSEGGAQWYTDQTNFLRSGVEDISFQAFEYLWDSFEEIEKAVASKSDCAMKLSTPMSGVSLQSGKIHFF